MTVNWGKAARAKRILMSGQYFNVPTARGPVAVEIELSLEFKARLGKDYQDHGDRGTGEGGDDWADLERELRERLTAICERSCAIFAEAAPKGASAERLAQIELFEGMEPEGTS